MRCFRHSDSEAIAICRSCGRALCDKCDNLIDDVMCCGEKCATHLKRQRGLEVLQVENTAMQSRGLKAEILFLRLGSAVVCVVGLVSLAYAAITYLYPRPFRQPLTDAGLGLTSLTFAVVFFWIGERFKSLTKRYDNLLEDLNN